jgi:hypothetical protein
MHSEAGGGEYLIHNNNSNDDAGGNTVITACGYNNWYLVSDTPNHSDMSVQTYPNVHRDYNDAPLTRITSARFAEGTALQRMRLQHRFRRLAGVWAQP